MSDTMLEIPQWNDIEPHLARAGVLTHRIKAVLQQNMVVKWIYDNVHPVIGVANLGLNDDEWKEIADELIDLHPTWQSPQHRRYRNAEKLVEGWQSGIFGDPESEDGPDELCKNRYAIISWYDGSSNVYSAGDSYKDILIAIHSLAYMSETPEHVDTYVDLDTGEHYGLYRGEDRIKTVVSLTLRGETYTHESE